RTPARLADCGLGSKGRSDALSEPGFGAPEVREGPPVGRRADLYALGAVLYAAATRQGIAEGKTREEVLESKGPKPPRDIKKTIPKSVEDFILSLVARDPAERPPSANAVIR